MENKRACMENSNYLKDTADSLNEQNLESLMKFSSGETLQHGGGQSNNASINLNPAKEANTASNGQQVPSYIQYALAKIQAHEAEMQEIEELSHDFDKKKALLSELKNMTNDMIENRINGDNDLENSVPFRNRYAAVRVQLNEISEKVTSSLLRSRQRSGYEEEPAANLGDSCLTFSLCDQPVQDSHSHVKDIIESSREKARTLVEEIVQEMLSLNQGENNPDQNDSQIPSELICHCVATHLMIQKCSEQQFPPTDVDQILESAVSSLKPSCSQNLPLYLEIQNCMGIIRNQILALKPT